MLTRYPILAMLAAVLAIAALVGCVHHVPTLTPAQSARLTTAQSLAVITEVNKTAAQSFVALNQRGAVSADLTRAALGYTTQVATTAKAAVVALQTEATPGEKSAAIIAALKSLSPPASVTAWASTPAAGQEVGDLIALVQSVRALIGGLQ